MEESDVNQSINTAAYKCELCNFETKYSQNLSAHFKSLKHINKVESKSSNELTHDQSSFEPAKKQPESGGDNR